MTLFEIAKALGPIDIKSVRRDSLLRWLIVYPVFVSLLIRWGIPLLTGRLYEQFQFDLGPYYLLLMSFVVLMTPMLAGVVVGFLLLDQRDNQTLTALQVTPLTLSGYFTYRIAMPAVVGFAVTILIFPVASLLKVAPLTIVGSAVSSCLLAPLYALFLGSFASNKVQGFALSKAIGILLVPPLIAYFVQPPWQWLFGIDPLYWPAKFLWTSYSGSGTSWIYLLVGLLFQWILLRLLMRRFTH